MSERPSYGEAEAKRIIARAAEIDAEQVARLNASALREIAAQSGISATAIDRALQEHESAAVTREPWLRRHRALLSVAAILAALLVVFLTRMVVPPHP